MKATLLGTERQNSPEWHALRSNGIGGSEIAAVVGLSPWISRFALWHRKRGTLREQNVNQAMTWGTRLEPVVCDVFAETHDMLDLVEAGTYANNERPWQLANVDRLCFDDEFLPEPVGLLEVKTASAFDAHSWGPDGSDIIPPYYRCQTLWYLDTLGLTKAWVAVLIGGADYREYEITYVPDEAEWLREEGRKFWNEVLGDEPPAIDGHTATYEAVRALHPDIEKDVEVELDADLWDEYSDSKTDLDAATLRHREAKSQVLDQMGQAQYAKAAGETVLRRQPGRGGAVSLYPVKTAKEPAA